MRQLKRAFTLLEISIVVMIISLLLTGVLVGQTVKENSAITKIIYDLNKYTEAVISFNQTYKRLPGDMSNAYTVFGSSCGGSAAKCNGDGDGIVEAIDSVDDDEFSKVFHHLTLADVIQERFLDTSFGNGVTAINGTVCGTSSFDTGAFPGLNSPELAIANGTIALHPRGGNEESHKWLVGKGRRCGYPMFSLFTPAQAKKLDRKLDNGVYNTGIFKVSDAVNGSGDTSCIVSSDFNLTNKKAACYVVYQAFIGLF